MKKGLIAIILIVLLAICFWTGRDIIIYVIDGYRAEQNKEELQHLYEVAKNEQINASHQPQQDDTTIDLSVNLSPLKELNENFQGWIYIEGTEIDYPIVQANDNDYYLSHDIHKKSSPRGAIFLDYRHHVNAEQIVIYGHHMKDNSMFGSLEHYEDKAFYDQNKYIDVQLGDELIRWEIFSVYVYKPTDDFFHYAFESAEDKSAYYERITKKSMYATEASIDSDEPLLTLVTCFYSSYDTRLIVHAKPKTINH